MKTCLAAGAAVLLLAHTAQAADLGGKVLKVGSDTTNPPLESVDAATNRVIGFDIDLVNAICAKINCRAEFVTTPWEGIFDALKQGKFDLVASDVSITEDREKEMDFSDPYLVSSQSILVRAANRNLTLDDFRKAHRHLAAQASTTNADLADELVGHDNVTLYDTFPAIIAATENGTVEGAVIDSTLAVAYEKEFAGRLVASIHDLKADPIGLAFRQGDPNVDAFDDGLRQVKADGTVDRLVAKYWGPR